MVPLPKDAYGLIPGACDETREHDQEESEVAVWCCLADPEMGRLSWVTWVAQCHHKVLKSGSGNGKENE